MSDPTKLTADNQTFKAVLRHLEGVRDREANACDPLEVIEAGIVKVDKKGNPLLEDGLPVIETRKVLKRDFILQQHNLRIAELKKNPRL